MMIEENNNEISAGNEEQATVRVCEVLQGMKQTVLVVEFEGPSKRKYLYRPERTLHFSPDPRVPIPHELYRDIAFHLVDKSLNWSVSAPVKEWELNSKDKGVIRPYWEHIEPLYPYSFTRMSLNDEYWQRVAVLDYMCGVVDRSANDFIRPCSENKTYVVDSGLSFVGGEFFTYQHSIVRDTLRGNLLNETVIEDIDSVNPEDLFNTLTPYVSEEGINWLLKRRNKVLVQGTII